MSSYGRPVTFEHGQASRVVGVMFDTTERKRLEQPKDDFIGIASHELKTPLTSIKAYTEILKDTFEQSGDNANEDVVNKLEAQVHRLAELIHSLLDTTKISEGQLNLSLERFSVNELIVGRVAEMQAAASGHKLLTRLDDDRLIVADRDRIGQVLTNLISNALKYSSKESEIVVGTKKTGDLLQVSVYDRGMGIPAEMTERIFDRFYRVPNNHVDTYPGMGLGLYISAAIVQKHGGKIWVDSKVNEGSTFYFTVPLTLKKDG